MTVKNLSTSYKIIKILKLMTEKPVTMGEIARMLEDEGEYASKETIAKYFSTLKQSGCNIQKKDNKYCIKYPILALEESEIQTLARFQKTVKDLSSKENYKVFLEFLEKLFTLVGEEDVLKYREMFKKLNENMNIQSTTLGKEYRDKIQVLSSFMGENPHKLKITCGGKQYQITPLKFIYRKTSVLLLGYDNKSHMNKNFSLKEISDIQSLPEKSANSDFGLSTTFKITGRLKNTYLLKEGETAMNYGDYLIVTNNKEDKTELFNRLLKYDTKCEILYPKSDREAFRELVKTLIEKHKN